MDCPVCLETIRKSGRSTIRLECSHCLCGDCATKWIVQNGHSNCPLCRAKTHHFSRETRSKKYSVLVAKAYGIVLQQLVEDDGNIDLKSFLQVLDILYFPCLDLWRRPDMLPIIRPIKDSIAMALQQLPDMPENLQTGLHDFVTIV
jgi:hypothetical protein